MKNYKPVSLISAAVKYLQSNFKNTSKRLFTMIKLYSRNRGMVKYTQINKCYNLYKKLKNGKHTAIWIDAQKILGKNSTYHILEVPKKCEIEEIYLNIIRAIYYS